MRTPSFATPLSNAFGLSQVGSYASPAFADIDGDGDADLFIGDDSGLCHCFVNTGSASAPAFQSRANGFGLGDVGRYASPSFADIDGDGDLDAFIGNYEGDVRFFRNTGSASAPAFTSESDNAGLVDVGYAARPAFVDIDDDGDLDAFIGCQAGTVLFLRNTGDSTAPAFATETTTPGFADLGSQSSPSFVDLDEDGDFDALIGERGPGLRFFRNVGDATLAVFTEEDERAGFLGIGSHAKATFADLDDDGDVDALVGQVEGFTSFARNTAGENTLPAPDALPTLEYVDTAFRDAFAPRQLILSASDPDLDDVLAFDLAGGTDNGDGTVSLAGVYGSLVLDRASRAAVFTPDAAALEALVADTGGLFIFTVGDGTGTVALRLALRITQQGSTESAGDDVLVGSPGNDVFDALGGDDQIDGGAGIDTAAYGSAQGGVVVSLALSGPQDTVSAGQDSLMAIENLVGSAFDDRLTGNALGNRLDGGAGADLLLGGAGNDTYLVDNPGDVITEARNAGTDTVLSAAATFSLRPNVENGRIVVDGAATLVGNALANGLTGGAGNNVLAGGNGVDRLTGGAGADRFDFNAVADSGLAAATRDSVLDFSHAQHDRLDLAGIDANTGKPGDQAFARLTSSNTTFSAKKSFTAPGQLYYDQKADVLYGNVDADAAPEFSIRVAGPGLLALAPADFML